MATIHGREGWEETTPAPPDAGAAPAGSRPRGIRRRPDAETAVLTVEEAVDYARAIAVRSTVTADDVVAAVAEMREARA
jgi:hypothetical protein